MYLSPFGDAARIMLYHTSITRVALDLLLRLLGLVSESTMQMLNLE
jgi:hypothetical protein